MQLWKSEDTLLPYLGWRQSGEAIVEKERV
jgi:hypothetical protein